MSKSKRPSKKEMAMAVQSAALPPIEPTPGADQAPELPAELPALVDDRPTVAGPERPPSSGDAILAEPDLDAAQAELDAEPCQVRERIVSNGMHCRHNGSFRAACDECMDALIANELPNPAEAKSWLESFGAVGLVDDRAGENLVDPVRRLRRLLLLKAAVDVLHEERHAQIKRELAAWERLSSQREELRRRLNGFRIVQEQREG